MLHELLPLSEALSLRFAVDKIIQCNALTEQFGLSLSEAQAAELVDIRMASLQKNGRIEFGGGIIEKLIYAFCDSPYITAENYLEALHELIELFYYFKNELLDILSDDELIDEMHLAFNSVCHGSLALLSISELESKARSMRGGFTQHDDFSEDEDEANEYE